MVVPVWQGAGRQLFSSRLPSYASPLEGVGACLAAIVSMPWSSQVQKMVSLVLIVVQMTAFVLFPT